jgi:hypothetical protein
MTDFGDWLVVDRFAMGIVGVVVEEGGDIRIRSISGFEGGGSVGDHCF